MHLSHLRLLVGRLLRAFILATLIVLLAETQLYEIKAAAGKGLGVFATQAIKCGTRIMAEKPIIHIKQGDPTIRESVDAYLHLSQAEQTVFISLHHYISPNLHSWKQFFLAEGVKEEDVNAFVHVMAVYEVNSFPADDGSILCPEASRMNHSCLPNVHHSWNKSRRCLTVHALRDIAAGEEIQTSYVELCLNSRQREKALDEYGFKCGCAACDATTDLGRVSNARRDQLYKVDKELNELVKGTRPMQRLQQILNALVEEKGLLSEEGLENIRLTLR